MDRSRQHSGNRPDGDYRSFFTDEYGAEHGRGHRIGYREGRPDRRGAEERRFVRCAVQGSDRRGNGRFGHFGRFVESEVR